MLAGNSAIGGLLLPSWFLLLFLAFTFVSGYFSFWISGCFVAITIGVSTVVVIPSAGLLVRNFALTSFVPKIFYAITAGLCLIISLWSSADFTDASFPLDKVFPKVVSEFVAAKILICSFVIGVAATAAGVAVLLATGANILTTGGAGAAVFTELFLFYFLSTAKILFVLF